ncbi:hypothetical protein BS78_02G351600 [Paspalum vaginatum]|nr:hypothetical protein BS78_02G351600 [Paspalum vaginatum]
MQDQCLVMSGPSHAVVVSNPMSDPVIVEVELKVKGVDEFRDKDLSLLAKPLTYSEPDSIASVAMLFAFGHISSSLEATIFVRVIDGSWPDCFHGQFAAHTSSIGNEKVIILYFGYGDMPISGDGTVKIFRHVVSVEVDGKLKVSFKASNKMIAREVAFNAARACRSYGTLHFGSCKMEVLIAWSPISPEAEPDN